MMNLMQINPDVSTDTGTPVIPRRRAPASCADGSRGSVRDGLIGNGTVRSASLVDIENAIIVGGRRLHSARLQEVFGFIDRYVAATPVVVATGEHILRSCMPELAMRGWGVRPVPTRPDAADRALLAAGHDFIKCGVTDLVVVSGDYAFAALAARARLHVITHREKLSKELRLAATTIAYLPCAFSASTRTGVAS